MSQDSAAPLPSKGRVGSRHAVALACERCATPFGPTDAVYEARRLVGPRPPWRLRPGWQRQRVCVRCAGSRARIEQCCAHCARPVFVLPRRVPGRPFCSPRCRSLLQSARRRRERAEPRPRTCDACGAAFTPPRKDGRYCSPACRQRAYRHRTRGAAS